MKKSIKIFVLIVLGSCLGIWVRYLLSLFYNGDGSDDVFRLAKLVTVYNLLSGLLLGFYLNLFSEIKEKFHFIKIFFTFAFLGSLSTFSTYILIMVKLIEIKEWIYLFYFVVLNNIGFILIVIFIQTLKKYRKKA